MKDLMTESAEKTEDTVQPEAEVTFADFNVRPEIVEALAEKGIRTPFPIQAETLPIALGGYDIIGQAKTGTGKTLGFGIPAIQRVTTPDDAGYEDLPVPGAPQALMVAPTRELAVQVAEDLKVAGSKRGIRIATIYGGRAYEPQIEELERGVEIVVGTPGRLIDLHRQRYLKLKNVNIVVLDEADEMLDLGFLPDVEKILSAVPEIGRQTMLFSATMPGPVVSMARRYMTKPTHIHAADPDDEGRTKKDIRQVIYRAHHLDKDEVIARILQAEGRGRTIVFTKTKRQADKLSAELQSRGFAAGAIHGDLGQGAREQALRAFRSEKIDVLVATDVAARGLDVERISHVYNYDIPMDTESYVHRIGRTGRAGRSGEAVLFVTPRENRMLKNIERATRQKVEKMTMPSIEQVNQARLGRFSERISRTLAEEGSEGQKLGQYRDLIEEFIGKHDAGHPGADPLQVAAALVAMVHEGRPLLLEDKGEDQLVRESQRDFSNDDRGGRDAGGRGGRERAPRQAGAGNAMYKIQVGRKDGVNPGHIVGAIANEAGMSSREIGTIDIRPSFSLVELPEKLSREQWDALGKTQIGGRAIRIERDNGAPGGGGFRAGDRGKRGGGYGGGKPHNKGGGFKKKSFDGDR